MGDTVNVTLTAPIDMDTAAVENGTVQVTNNTTGERTDVTVTERSASSTVFTGSFELPNAESVTVINNVCPEPMQRYNVSVKWVEKWTVLVESVHFSTHLTLTVLCCVKPISTYKENGRPKANTHKDNNEIPLRAREVLPGNRKDFSFVQKSAGLHPRPEDAV